MRKEQEIIDSVIHHAPLEMQEMLRSVYRYCSSLLLMGHEKLLERILFAFTKVDRKFFIDNEDPYADIALHIGEGQTISQPSTVAAMLLYANIQEQDYVLEIGSGSGWNAALLSFLSYPGKVVSLERHFSLVEKAKKNVAYLKKYLNQAHPQISEKIKPLFLAEDILAEGKVWKKKYHKIIFTAGVALAQEKKIKEIADALLLRDGLLVCPRISGPIIIFKKQGDLMKYETKEEYMFVPLKEGVEK